MYYCKNNNDCDQGSFCCSTLALKDYDVVAKNQTQMDGMGLCQVPQLCNAGMKNQLDYCEFGFECASRCCTSDQCSPPNSCHLICEKNFDCLMMGKCCSEGHCTQDLVCKEANKIIGDYCDENSECITNYCDLTGGPQDKTCNMVPSSKKTTQQFISHMLAVLLYIIIVAFVGAIIYFMWYFLKQNQQSGGSY